MYRRLIAAALTGLAWFVAHELLADETPSPTATADATVVETPPPPTGPQKAGSPNAAATVRPRELSVEALARRTRDSIVVIRVAGRDGRENGVGTGFVISADGLIATNLHVIGEARPIRVELADGRSAEVVAIEATDRSNDLAVLRVATPELPPLPLGDSAQVEVGQAVVAVGNPHGLDHSVVSGVVSGRREIDGMPMIQLAIPVEPGNSGGPLLDRQGRVQGIVTMKSAVTDNLGFAVEIDAMKPLLAAPNPVPIERWLTIGALDGRVWTTRFGANWRQRAGRISVTGVGSGFGGRALCLSTQPPPKLPFEVAVTVKLDDESGAAGLVFGSDGGDHHFGFYPSGGRLRLSRFDGPDASRWQVLEEVDSSAYQPGEWNTLKVRVEKDRLRCFVNDASAIEFDLEPGVANGQVGLAKFRQTSAEFKQFAVARKIASLRAPPEVVKRLDLLLGEPPTIEAILPELVETLVPDATQSGQLLRERAELLTRQAEHLRQLADRLHRREVLVELERLFRVENDEQIDLLRAALLLARLDNAEVNVEAYVADVERMANEVAEGLPDDADETVRLDALNRYLFVENGFHGSRGEYYHRANSYLNEVIDDREGLPITLSVLYLELGRRLRLNIEGVGLPGHFVVRHLPAEGKGVLIDVFDRGRKITRREANELVLGNLGRPLVEGDLQAAPRRSIVLRMMRNLLGVAMREHNTQQILHDLDAILTISPDSHEDRSLRAVLLFRAGRLTEARLDVDWLLESNPAGLDVRRLLEFRQRLVE